MKPTQTVDDSSGLPPPWDRIFGLGSRIFVWGLLFSILYLLRPFFLLVFLTFVFAYILEHGVVGLQHRIRSRPLRVILVSTVFLSTLISAAIFLTPHFIEQGRKLEKNYPNYLNKIDEALDGARTNNAVRTLIPPRIKARDLLSELLGFLDHPEESGSGDGGPPKPKDTAPEAITELDLYPGGLSQLVKDADLEWKDFLDFCNGRGQKAPVEVISKLTVALQDAGLVTTSDNQTLNAKWLSTQWDIEGNQQGTELQAKIAQTIETLKNITAPVLGISSALLLSLLFSFLIVLDLPKLSRAVAGLTTTKISFIYDEVAPNVRDFGKMLGRALEAQLFIALCNTALTAIGLYALDLSENLVFFSTIVFFCSFIPVAGVFLSTTPIALEALSQPENGVQLMVLSIVMVLVIHFVEAYFLNPKIFGHHLHMNAVLVLIVLTICGKLFGVWGLVLGLPVVNYFFGHAIRRRDRSQAPSKPAAAPG